jgi:hypothetical protein
MDQCPQLTEEQLQKLPRWARVAFAARCARRAQRLLTRAPSEMAGPIGQTVEAVITLAERFGSDGRPCMGLEGAITAVEGHARAAASSVQARSFWGGSGTVSVSQAVRDAVIRAAAAAARAASETSTSAYWASQAVALAGEAGQAFKAADFPAGIERDFRLLREATDREGWTDETPVSPNVFGTL